MTWEELQEVIIETSPLEWDQEQVQPDSRLIEDLQYDSLAVMELLAEVEIRFGVDYTELRDFDERFDICQELLDGINELLQLKER